MNSIYMILLALFLLKFADMIAIKKDNKYKYIATKGILIFASLIALFGSIIIHILEALI